MKFVTTVWATFTLFLMLVGFLPLLGLMNWLNIPVATLGLVVSSVVSFLDRRGAGERRYAFPIIAFLAAIILGVIRLHVGFGIF